MSLNFDHSKVEDKGFIWVPAADIYGEDVPKHLVDKELMNPRFESVIWATMAVDMGEVTEKNKVEFYLRYLLWNRLILNEPTPYLKFNDIEKAVGLTTNVFTKTNASFKKDTWDRAIRELGYKIEKERTDEV